MSYFSFFRYFNNLWYFLKVLWSLFSSVISLFNGSRAGNGQNIKIINLSHKQNLQKLQKWLQTAFSYLLSNSNSYWLQINFQTSLSIDNKLFLLSVKLAQKGTVKIKATTSSISSIYYNSIKHQENTSQ